MTTTALLKPPMATADRGADERRVVATEQSGNVARCTAHLSTPHREGLIPCVVKQFAQAICTQLNSKFNALSRIVEISLAAWNILYNTRQVLLYKTREHRVRKSSHNCHNWGMA